MMVSREALVPGVPDGKQVEADRVIAQLRRDKASLEERVEFLEEIVGPTEAQRKQYQHQIVAARAAALRARHCGVAIPTRFAGRLDERWLRSRGVNERDAALLQRGCLMGPDGLPQDVSMLGDPAFRPYEEHTQQPRWQARGGALQLSLQEVRDRWGEEVALAVVRCAQELDKYDGSRRLGVELPWHGLEDRELQPAEIIYVMERELSGGTMDASGFRGSPSPTDFSVIESVMSADGTASSATTDVTILGGAEDEEFEPQYEWSLADADIQQLLSGKQPATRAMLHAQAAHSSASAIAEGLYDEEEALLEMLEKEVASSLGMAPTPDPSMSPMSIR